MLKSTATASPIGPRASNAPCASPVVERPKVSISLAASSGASVTAEAGPVSSKVAVSGENITGFREGFKSTMCSGADGKGFSGVIPSPKAS
ncbi:hypothetical protein OK016_27235 [Vibrio chagasii]|nr:hypothetical protein [Vibrio chagasii]